MEQRIRRRVIAVSSVAAVLLAITVTAVTLTGGSSPTPLNQGATAITPTTNAQTPDPEQQAYEAQAKADQKQAQGIVNGIETRVKATPSRDDKLSIILTEYCRLGAGRDREITSVDSDVLLMLRDLYEKYWSAGGKWNRPIDSAAAQQGACPSYFTTPPPPQGPAG